jgi:hypothetical protein
VREYSSTFHDEPRGVFRVLGTVGFPGSQALVEAWLVAAIVGGAVLARRREVRGRLGACAVIGVLAIAEFFISWHGDVFEIDRHALSSAVALRVVLLVVSALALDGLIRSRRTTKGSGGPSPRT